MDSKKRVKLDSWGFYDPMNRFPLQEILENLEGPGIPKLIFGKSFLFTFNI